MRILRAGAVLTSAAALLCAAACGSSSGDKTSATPSGAASSRGAAGFTAYADCLRQHGVKVPSARPSGRPGGGAIGGGGGAIGGGGGFRGGNIDPKALQACRSLMPQFGNRGQGMQELQAFRSCLSDHGVKMPTPSPDPSRTAGARRVPGGGFGRFDTSDPKVAKAVKTCRPLLPSRGPRPSPS